MTHYPSNHQVGLPQIEVENNPMRLRFLLPFAFVLVFALPIF